MVGAIRSGDRRCLCQSAPLTVPEITLDESKFVEMQHKNKYGQDYPASAYDPGNDSRAVLTGHAVNLDPIYRHSFTEAFYMLRRQTLRGNKLLQFPDKLIPPIAFRLGEPENKDVNTDSRGSRLP